MWRAICEREGCTTCCGMFLRFGSLTGLCRGVRVRMGILIGFALSMVELNPQVSVSKTTLAAFCQEHGIRRLAVFGSALRDDFGPESDINLLVEFEPDRIPGLLGVAGMELTLSELFAGRKVDLRTAEDLSPYFRQEVLAGAEVQYEQA